MPNQNSYSQTYNPSQRNHLNFSLKSSNNNAQTSQPPFQAHHCHNSFFDYFPNSLFLFQKIKKKFKLKKNSKNNNSEKKMSEHPENGQKLVEEAQKFKD